MAGKIRKLFSKIGQLLLGKKPPQLSKPNLIGPRGIAAGNLKERQRRQEAGEQPYSAEEIEKWRTLSKEEVDGFLDNEEPLFVHSSNVSYLQYFPVDQKLIVGFLNGSAYIYSNVTKQEAQQFVTAQSKGSEVWNTLRVRGSRTAHKKPWRKIK